MFQGQEYRHLKLGGGRLEGRSARQHLGEGLRVSGLPVPGRDRAACPA